MKSSAEEKSNVSPSKPAHKARTGSVRAVQRRLILSFATIMGAALALSGFAFVTDSKSRLRSQLSDESRSAASVLAASLPLSVRDEDRDALEAAANELITMQQVSEVAFFNAHGRLLVHAGSYDETDSLASLNGDSLTTIVGSKPKITDEYVQAAVPVIDRMSWRLKESGKTSEHVGYIAVRVPTTRVGPFASYVEKAAVGIGGLVSLASMSLFWMLVRNIMGPLKRLTIAVQKVATGDLSVRAEQKDDAYLGGLAGAFNQLADSVSEHRRQLAQTNEQLAKNNSDLEATVATRTIQLEAAASRLQSEIAEKEDFLRAISHDLNAPLRNIGGMVTMLMMKNKELSDDVLQRLERIKKNVEVETDLINELLELSRIKTRRQTFEKVDLEAMVWDLRGLFESDLKTRVIEIVLDTSLPVLWAEKARIRQIFQNLVDNAIKYMGDRPVREIHIGCRVTTSEAEFWVRDTGIGIHPEDIDKVFFVFRRGRGDTTQKVSGKGVGLASVKSIIETYNGRIWVESVLGEGTAFKFTINGKYVPALTPIEQTVTKQIEEVDARNAA